MDAQEPIVSDFSFAFKRRSHSPSPHDCLAPATLHRAPSTNGSQSPPPSLSDATSSHGSPKEWNSLSWNPGFPIPDMNLASPSIHWQWQQKQSQPAFLQAVDPLTLALDEAISLASEPQYFNPSALPPGVSSHSTYSFLQALNVLPETNIQANPTLQGGVGYTQPLSAEMAIGLEESAQDNEAIIAAIKASGIHIAALDPNSRDILSTVPIRSPTPPPPKPDLTACPPLAKHLQPATPSTNSQGSRPDSPCVPEAESQVIYGASGRPKTSHTTIERRYRTNLNARILALRRAVPALRILEKDENQNPMFPEDVIDERGFVDGVRAARKASKASILGKAAEYIHVLKKREIRLRHESSGLRLLIGSLVGGQALLREFDRTWKDRYGGEEMDEAMDLSDGEEDDCTDEDEDKPRKRTKTTNAKPLSQKKDKKVAEPTPDTGKRKRGRPKKVQTADDASPSLSSVQSNSHVSIPPSPRHQDESKSLFGAQYLLGAFLFFSFFQSPADSQLHYPHESHSGSVIASSSPKVAQHLGNVVLTGLPGIRSAAPIIGLFVLLTWVIPSVRRALSWAPSRAESKLQISEALTYSNTERSVQASSFLRRSLGIGGPITETIRLLSHSSRASTPEVMDSLETRAWLRLVNLELIHGTLNGTSPKVNTLLALSRCLPRTPPALVALAMLAQSFSSVLAQRYWNLARSMVLDGSQYPEESMEAVALKMSVQDAHSLLVKGIRQGLMDPLADATALQTIGAVLVLEAFHSLAKAELSRVVESMTSHAGGDRVAQHEDKEIEEAMAFVSNTGGSVGGPCGQLLRLWKDGFHSMPDKLGSSLDALTGAAADTRDLVNVVALLRGIQETGLLTPTSSTSSLRGTVASPLSRDCSNTCGGTRQRSLSNRLLLRQLLAAPVFESEDMLEDVRDSIIDMLYEGRR